MLIDDALISFPIGGFTKLSLIDYPGHLSSVVFTSGCNFRCNYCHNPELVIPKLIKENPAYSFKEIFHWIYDNNSMLDAIVITGGEPTIHGSLPSFIRRLKQLGLKIKLDTNGTNPTMLKKLIEQECIDYIAMDIKAPLNQEKYQQIIGVKLEKKSFAKINESISIITNSRIDHEFRTTLDSRLNFEEVKKITEEIPGKLFLQKLHFNEKFIEKQIPTITEESLATIAENSKVFLRG